MSRLCTIFIFSVGITFCSVNTIKTIIYIFNGKKITHDVLLLDQMKDKCSWMMEWCWWICMIPRIQTTVPKNWCSPLRDSCLFFILSLLYSYSTTTDITVTTPKWEKEKKRKEEEGVLCSQQRSLWGFHLPLSLITQLRQRSIGFIFQHLQ